MRRRSLLVAGVLLGVVLTAVFVGSAGASGARIESAPLPHERDASSRAGWAAEERSARPRSAISADCLTGTQDSGAKYRICLPDNAASWNHQLAVYAHGYMAPDRAVEIPEDQMVLPGTGQRVDDIITGMGYGFAASSYYTNGLAVLPGISDLLDVVSVFTATYGPVDRVLLAGVSEGGLIAALSVERHPEVYDGGMALCGPYGDFQVQINHFGDFRIVFDYFFPGVMPGEPLSIPVSLRENWDTFFADEVLPIVEDPANASAVDQLLQVTDVSPYGYAPPVSTESIERLLWYNAFATNDGVAKLGGQPFDNQDPYRWYTGSDNDTLLNEGGERISGDPVGQAEIEANYQTSGFLSVPLVTMHTTGDPIVPYRHATLYREKAEARGRQLLHRNIEVEGHGHCAFSFGNVFEAFGTLISLVDNPPSWVYLPMVARAP